MYLSITQSIVEAELFSYTIAKTNLNKNMTIGMDSMMMTRRKKKEGCIWQVRPVWEGRKEMARHMSIPELLVQLLYNRGVTELDSARAFLSPSLNDLIEPQAFTGMEPAVRRIREAVAKKQKITLYGDYDVDGIVGVAILWRCLHLAVAEVDFYVPHRLEEGYGLNVEAIRQLAEQGTKLIVTVDCGIRGHEAVAEAIRLGIDVIVTDHHKIEGEPVAALTIVHPGLPGQQYPNPHLCGAGVAFKLAWGLAQSFSGATKVSDEFRAFLLSATALAGLGTIADVVPLLGENRALVRFGMDGLVNSSDHGIRALMVAAGLNGGKLKSSDVAFRLAPKINAAGRMGHARLAVELLTKSSPDKAMEIARYLESQNRLRQKVEKEIAEQAIEQVRHLKMDTKKWRAIVVNHEEWHGGVIGIVASRLVDKFGKPTIVITRSGEKMMGSCRSIPGFDICLALEACSEYLLGFGGHTMAAGLTLEESRIDLFRETFNQYAIEHLSEADLAATLDIDAEAVIADLRLPTVEAIERLQPFGQGNPPVRLALRGLELVGQPLTMGAKGAHLAFSVAEKGNREAVLRPGGMMRVVAFSQAKWDKKLRDAESFDLVAEPVINRFNGNTTVELVAEDIHFHD